MKKYLVYVAATLPVHLTREIFAESADAAKKRFIDICQNWESTQQRFLPDCECQDFRLTEDELLEIGVEEDL